MDRLTEEVIKKNSGILRQFTALNNEIKDLKGRVLKLERMSPIEEIAEHFRRKGYEVIPGNEMTEKEISEIKVGGTDPD